MGRAVVLGCWIPGALWHRRDCALTIDSKHPATLSLTHKAPASIITDCQSVTIEYDGCGLFFQAIGHLYQRNMLGNQSVNESHGASWVILTLCECSGGQLQASVPQNIHPARACLRQMKSATERQSGIGGIFADSHFLFFALSGIYHIFVISF